MKTQLALPGGTVADVSSDQPEIVSVVDYDPATVASPGFSVTVTQLAGSVDTKLVTSGDGLTAADFVNGGAAFYLEGTTQEGTSFTIPFAETVTGTPPATFAASTPATKAAASMAPHGKQCFAVAVMMSVFMEQCVFLLLFPDAAKIYRKMFLSSTG
mgnify:CR=1 FL=1